MLKKTNVQMFAVMAIGVLLGFAAASGKLDVFGRASSEQSQRSVAETESRPAGGTTCCSDSLSKGQLVAKANTKVKEGGDSAQEKDGKKPNIVMLMTDDAGWNDFGCYSGGGQALGHPTPNIDRIAKEGALFTCWYGQASCTAGRSSFITGRIPIRSALSVVVVPGDENALHKETPTIVEFFKKNSYSTYFSGKWHLGDKPEDYPIEHGFDEMKAFAAYYPGVYTYSDTSRYFHPWFPSYNPEFKKAYFDVVNMFEWEGVSGQPAKKVAEITYDYLASFDTRQTDYATSRSTPRTKNLSSWT
jgi:arylsulfatase